MTLGRRFKNLKDVGRSIREEARRTMNTNRRDGKRKLIIGRD
jgi:hypothetical protein